MKSLFSVLALAATLALAAPAVAQDLPDLGGRTIKAVTENAYYPLNFEDPTTGTGIGLEYDVFNEIGNRLGEGLKQSPAKDIEQNLKAGLTSMLGKLDMVSREEFDVQTEVLARTREMLAQLEARLAELEKQQREE